MALLLSGRRFVGRFAVYALTLLPALVPGIISAIAVPGLLRARMSGNEASSIGSLRANNSAQSTYAASCGSGFYAPSLVSLATPPTVGGGDGFVGTDLGTDPSVKSSYTIALTAGTTVPGAPASCNGVAAGATVSTYFVAAGPTAGGAERISAIRPAEAQRVTVLGSTRKSVATSPGVRRRSGA